MKPNKRLILVLVLLLLALIPVAVAAAAGRDGYGRGSLIIRDGQPFANPMNLPKTAGGAATAGPTGAAPTQLPAPPQPLAPVKWTENWEGSWPAGLWTTYDANGGEDICWDETWVRKYRGRWSASPSDGCADAPGAGNYVNNMDSRMTFGPFSTMSAERGGFDFRYWMDTEAGWDYLNWCASVDNVNLYCHYDTGLSGKPGKPWVRGRMDLRDVPGFGSMLGYPEVWVTFTFWTDGSVNSDYGYEGAYVDDFRLRIVY